MRAYSALNAFYEECMHVSAVPDMIKLPDIRNSYICSYSDSHDIPRNIN